MIDPQASFDFLETGRFIRPGRRLKGLYKQLAGAPPQGEISQYERENRKTSRYPYRPFTHPRCVLLPYQGFHGLIPVYLDVPPVDHALGLVYYGS